MRVDGHFELGKAKLDKKRGGRELGGMVTEKLSRKTCEYNISAETYNPLWNMRAPFTYPDEDMVRGLIVTLRHHRLEYSSMAWSQSLKKHVRKLEKIQRAATRMAPSLSDLSDEGKSLRLKLPALEAI